MDGNPVFLAERNMFTGFWFEFAVPRGLATGLLANC